MNCLIFLVKPLSLAGADLAQVRALIPRKIYHMNTAPETKKSAHAVDIAVGVKMRQLRKARGMSQSGFARILGVSFQQIQKYESASNRISASRLYEVAQILDMTPADFFAEVVDGPAPKAVLKVDPKGEEDLHDALLTVVANVLQTQNRQAKSTFVRKLSAMVRAL